MEQKSPNSQKGFQCVPNTDDMIIEKINSVEHWYHQIEIKPGIVTPGINNSAKVLELLDIPPNCSGMKVLDIGTRDGFFAFEFEKRGAEVVGVDYFPSDRTGFKIAAELLNSKVTYIQDNIYNISKEKYGSYDIVLALGLIYHLRDPLGALDIIRDICENELYLETQVIDNAFLLPNGNSVELNSISHKLEEIPIMQFYPKDSLNKDFSNYWAPNMKCMVDMLTETKFSIMEKKLSGSRAIFKCKIAFDQTLEHHKKIAKGLVHP